ncbi:MAG: hypothetical protein Kow0059_13040 [Candidatus Sumerlaeia bacterium]
MSDTPFRNSILSDGSIPCDRNMQIINRETLFVPAMLALVLLGGFLRLYRLADNPLWYTDECDYAAVARSLAEGEARVGAIRHPFGRQFLCKPPLWFLLDAPLQWLPGETLVKGRMAAALASLALAVVLGLLGRRLHSTGAGLLAAWVSLLHGPAMLYGRWATPYPLAGLLNALAVLAVAADAQAREREAASPAPSPQSDGVTPHRLQWGRERALVLAGAMAGLAMTTEFFSVQTALFILVWIALRRRWSALPGAVAAMAVPPLAFVVWGLSVRGGDFVAELLSLLSQVGEEARRVQTALAPQLLFAVRAVLLRDFVLTVGTAGLVVWTLGALGILPVRGGARRTPARSAAAAAPGLFLLCMMPFVLRRQGFDPEAPHNLPEYGFALYLGFGVSAAAAAGRLAKWIERRAARSSRSATGKAAPVRLHWSVAALVVVPMIFWTGRAIHAAAAGIPMGAKAIGSVRNLAAARTLAEELRSTLPPAALAVLPTRLLPLAPFRAVPAPQVLLAEAFAEGAERVPLHWHVFVRPGEMAFLPTLDRVRAVVIDDWDRLNGLDPRLPEPPHPLARLMRERGWHLWRTWGEYQVFVPPPAGRRLPPAR